MTSDRRIPCAIEATWAYVKVCGVCLANRTIVKTLDNDPEEAAAVHANHRRRGARTVEDIIGFWREVGQLAVVASPSSCSGPPMPRGQPSSREDRERTPHRTSREVRIQRQASDCGRTEAGHDFPFRDLNDQSPGRGNPPRWSPVPRPSHHPSAYVTQRRPAGFPVISDTAIQLAQCPVKNNQLHHSIEHDFDQRMRRPRAADAKVENGLWMIQRATVQQPSDRA